VVLLCATEERQAPWILTSCGFASGGRTQEAEAALLARHLGLKVHFLGYRDSGMPGTSDNAHPDAQIAHPVAEVAGRIVKHIREIRPDVVLTFDPVGGYRHPDHIHVHQATTLAFEGAADPAFHPGSGEPFQPRALFYHVFPHGFLRMLTRLMPVFGVDPRRFGRNKDIDLKALTEFEFPAHVRIDTSSVAAAGRGRGMPRLAGSASRCEAV
jgi:LmbE family N-acetylglucosaminyl deacetylase